MPVMTFAAGDGERPPNAEAISARSETSSIETRTCAESVICGRAAAVTAFGGIERGAHRRPAFCAQA